MATIESRLERIETEIRFRFWVRWLRMVKDMNIDEMEVLASTGQWSNRPEPAQGASPLDAMDRTSLLKMWKEDQRGYAGRNNEQLVFYACHGHWPEQACSECCPVEGRSQAEEKITCGPQKER
jgi:hypothetical protein